MIQDTRDIPDEFRNKDFELNELEEECQLYALKEGFRIYKSNVAKGTNGDILMRKFKCSITKLDSNLKVVKCPFHVNFWRNKDSQKFSLRSYNFHHNHEKSFQLKPNLHSTKQPTDTTKEDLFFTNDKNSEETARYLKLTSIQNKLLKKAVSKPIYYEIYLNKLNEVKQVFDQDAEESSPVKESDSSANNTELNNSDTYLLSAPESSTKSTSSPKISDSLISIFPSKRKIDHLTDIVDLESDFSKSNKKVK